MRLFLTMAIYRLYLAPLNHNTTMTDRPTYRQTDRRQSCYRHAIQYSSSA